MECTWKTVGALLITVAALVSNSCVVDASPIPGSSGHLVHSLATYATTNSFLYYTNKIGPLNYRFTKPQLSQLQTYTKFSGFPQLQGYASPSPTEQISSAPIVTTGSNDDVVPVAKTISSEEIKLLSSGDLSTFLSPPEQGTPLSTFTQVDNDKSLTTNSALELEKLESLPDKEFVSRNHDGVSSVFSPVNVNISKSEDIVGTVDTTSNIFPLSVHDNKNEDDNLPDSKSSLEELFTRVINAPFRKASLGHTESELSSDSPHFNALESQLPKSRQDSNFEQPIPFFSRAPQKFAPPQGIPNSLHRPPVQLPLPGNFRFTIPPTTSQQQPLSPGLIPGHTRFSSQHNNFLSERPTFQAIQPQSQPHHPPSPPSAPQIPSPQFSSDNNGFPAPPSIQGPPNQQQAGLPFPSSPFQQPNLQYPHPQLGGAPPQQQEPENGFNPFHLHENYPEPPYESEFANYPPLNDEQSGEQSHQSFARHNAPQPPPLDFAQSTLRNVRTEELLDVVQRKPVPPACVYNSISYGPNGEDCIEARKK